MEPKDKHNIFSKEELFRLIDEKKSLPPEADDFDKEAMEGLAMVKDRARIDSLHDAIDETLRLEKKRAAKKRNMYFFAAAASLMLIVGLFFLLKENTIQKEDNGLAENKIVKTDEAPVNGLVQSPDEKAAAAAANEGTATGETQAKEVAREAKIKEEISTKETFASDVTTVSVPEIQAEPKTTLAMNEKATKGADLDANLDDKKAGGKAEQIISNLEEQEQKRELAKKAEDKSSYKKKADEKTVHYETNTVWTSSTGAAGSKDVADELKQQSTSKPGAVSENRNNNQVATGSSVNAAPVQTQGDVAIGGLEEDNSKTNAPQKNAEVLTSSQKIKEGPFGKKYRAKKSKSNAPSTRSTPAESAGYAYYAQTSTRTFTSPEFVGGNEALQKYVKGNLKISAPDKTGTVVVEFLIKKDGSIEGTDIKILTPVKDCEVCNKDVTELVKNMPKWKPATENGQGKEYRQKLSVVYDVNMNKN